MMQAYEALAACQEIRDRAERISRLVSGASRGVPRQQRAAYIAEHLKVAEIELQRLWDGVIADEELLDQLDERHRAERALTARMLREKP